MYTVDMIWPSLFIISAWLGALGAYLYCGNAWGFLSAGLFTVSTTLITLLIWRDVQ